MSFTNKSDITSTPCQKNTFNIIEHNLQSDHCHVILITLKMLVQRLIIFTLSTNYVTLSNVHQFDKTIL